MGIIGVEPKNAPKTMIKGNIRVFQDIFLNLAD